MHFAVSGGTIQVADPLTESSVTASIDAATACGQVTANGSS
ncbi:hypothetical protein ABZ863_22980 [Saccharomonospora sp. NPDC046836]